MLWGKWHDRRPAVLKELIGSRKRSLALKGRFKRSVLHLSFFIKRNQLYEEDGLKRLCEEEDGLKRRCEEHLSMLPTPRPSLFVPPTPLCPPVTATR